MNEAILKSLSISTSHIRTRRKAAAIAAAATSLEAAAGKLANFSSFIYLNV